MKPSTNPSGHAV